MGNKLDKSKLKPITKTVTTPMGKNGEMVTLRRKYWVKPEENHIGLKKIGMGDNEIAIVNRLLNHTDEVYLVGGAVRDLLMGKKPHDFDVATNLKPEQIIGIFGEKFAKVTGNVFPTVRVKHGNAEIEVSTFRKEISTGVEGDRNAFSVEFSDKIEEDLHRRDLTINALAINAKTGQLVDIFGGAGDIKNKVIRFVGDPYERLNEDPLRYLRAIRFKLRLGGNYAASTKEALSNESIRDLFLEKVSGDRIKEELMKGVEGIEKFSGFFNDLHEFGMMEDLFPEIHQMVDHDGGPWHGEDIFTHSMMVGDNYGKANPDDKRDVLGKLSAYLHDIGKTKAYDPVERTFYDHERIGAEEVPSMLKRFRFSNEEISFIQQMISNHMKKPTTLKGVRKMYTEIGENYPYLVNILKADTMSNLRKTPEEVSKSLEYVDGVNSLIQDVVTQKETFLKVDVNGHDLMTTFNLKPGPHLKDMLEFAKDLVLEDPEFNRKDLLIGQIREKFNL